MPDWSMNIEQRYVDSFWKKVSRPDWYDCWIWTGCRNRLGYGQIYFGPLSRVLAHRLSWMMHNGDIPEGKCVLHNCPGGDNPSCVNPAHLWLGTKADNMVDMIEKGRARHHGLSGEAHVNSRLSESQVREIRHRWEAGESQTSLGSEFGVCQGNISGIVRGILWKHIL